jgi:hypothetical protein
MTYIRKLAAPGLGMLDSAYNGSELTVGQESLPRDLVLGSIAMSTGVLRLRYFTARKTEDVANIRMRTGTTAAAATPTLCRMGIYSVAANGDITLFAACANDTSLFASINTTYTKALTSTVTLVKGTRYAFGAIVVTGTTAPTVLSSNSTLDSVEVAVAPRLTATLTAQTDLTTPITAGTLANTAVSIYGVVTP